MLKKNIPLLKRLRTRFLRMRHEQRFDMDSVARQTDCGGAAMCIAGHTLELEGYKVKFDEYGDPSWLLPSGRRMRASRLRTAARLLGLPYAYNSDSAGYALFHDFLLKTPKQAAKRIAKLIEEG